MDYPYLSLPTTESSSPKTKSSKSSYKFKSAINAADIEKKLIKIKKLQLRNINKLYKSDNEEGNIEELPLLKTEVRNRVDELTRNNNCKCDDNMRDGYQENEKTYKKFTPGENLIDPKIYITNYLETEIMKEEKPSGIYANIGKRLDTFNPREYNQTLSKLVNKIYDDIPFRLINLKNVQEHVHTQKKFYKFGKLGANYLENSTKKKIFANLKFNSFKSRNKSSNLNIVPSKSFNCNSKFQEYSKKTICLNIDEKMKLMDERIRSLNNYNLSISKKLTKLIKMAQ